MGNVLAASSSGAADSKRNLSLPNFATALPEPAAETDSKKSSNDKSGESSDKDAKDFIVENPGTIEELHKKCKDVQAMTFEGAKIMLNKGLSNHFQVSHTINMGTMSQSGYRFGATYVGTKHYGPTEAFPVLLGDIDPSGNLNANIIHQFSNRVRSKLAAQIQDSQLMASQLTTDFRGKDCTFTFTLGNPNIFEKSGVIVGQYLQALNPRLTLGTELAYQVGANVPGGKIAVVSAVARYSLNDAIWSGTIGPSGLVLCYYQRSSEQLQIGIELETSLRMQESVATIGYQVDLPKADLVFRGGVDSNWHIRGVLEKRLAPLPFAFSLSGCLNQKKNHFRLGCGLMIG